MGSTRPTASRAAVVNADASPVRLRATSPTYGQVTIVIVDEPGQDRFYLLCLETTLSAPQLIRRWRRRTWIEFVFRTLKHLLATEACQVHSEDAYYGHLVLRLMASFVLFYTSRVICKGRSTMEEIIFHMKHYWRFVDLEALESATSGKAGGLKKVEPLKAVDVVNRSKRFGCEPPTGGPAYHRSI